MAIFQNIREQTEQKVMVHLLTEIEGNPSFTQRGLAGELGIALGLMNQYLKRCLTKGWIRASQVSSHRITYFLTPAGFKEKSLMVGDYLARSFTFFRDAKAQCEEAFIDCKTNGWLNIALVGSGDLADIAKLVAHGIGVGVNIMDLEDIIGSMNQCVDADSMIDEDKLNLKKIDLKVYDAVLVTDVINPQSTYDAIHEKVEYQRLLTLKLLHISRVIP